MSDFISTAVIVFPAMALTFALGYVVGRARGIAEMVVPIRRKA